MEAVGGRRMSSAMTPDLSGRVAVVTGAAGGIGLAYAQALAQAGAAVALVDLDHERAEEAAETLRADGLQALGVGADVGSPEAVEEMAARTIAAFGGVDILVNNAALMAQLPQVPLVDFPLDWWERTLRVNLTGALLCAKACVPSMRERGGGRIVNQSSGGAWVNWRPYGISKMALVGLTYGLARDLGPDNITVNAIAPGLIETEAALGMHPAGSPFRTRMTELMAIERGAGPEELVGALLYFVSPAGRWVTGQCLNVDGGWVMRF